MQLKLYICFGNELDHADGSLATDMTLAFFARPIKTGRGKIAQTFGSDDMF